MPSYNIILPGNLSHLLQKSAEAIVMQLRGTEGVLLILGYSANN